MDSLWLQFQVSVVIPIVFGVLLYRESLGLIKIAGILFALMAVYLTSVKGTGKTNFKISQFYYPVILFLGSGAIDTLLKYTETTYVKSDQVSMFSASIFGIAFCLGFSFLIVQLVRRKTKFHWRNSIAGIALGIPNYFSIDFLLRALKTEGIESSTLFTINNVCIVLLTTLFGLFFFKEKLEKRNWAGIGLAIIGIILITIV